MSFLQILKKESEKVSVLLDAFCKELPDSKVSQAMLYSLRSGGKRLRPVLALQTAKMLGAPEGIVNVERIAAAVEMIHTYSLIHDDLPCMDDDDFRRNRPACHKVFGEGAAVLAGDALLNLSFEVLLNGDYVESYIKAVKFIAECAGIGGMIGGQADDISTDGQKNIEELTALAANKTAKLIAASVVSVGVYLNCSAARLKALNDFALNFGIAFQIADDLLDAKNSETANFASALGSEAAKELLKNHSFKASKAINIFGKEEAAFFRALVNFNKERTA